nr:hypothetical protein [Saccharofermentans sp.]
MDLIEQVHRWIIGAPTSYQMKSSCYKRFREFAVLEIDKSGSLGVNENGASLLSLEYAMEYSEREIKKLYNSSKGYIIPCDRFSIVDIASSRRRRMVFLGSVEAKKDPLIETIQIYKNSLDDERAVVTFRINLRSCVRSAKEAFDYIDANGYRNAIRDSYPLITKEFMQHIYTRDCFYE